MLLIIFHLAVVVGVNKRLSDTPRANIVVDVVLVVDVNIVVVLVLVVACHIIFS